MRRPADKLAAIATMQAAGRRVGMVGDGLNDAPVMARADVSFAIGDGPALTRSNADFVLLSGRLGDIAEARRISRRAMRIVRQNMAWAVGLQPRLRAAGARSACSRRGPPAWAWRPARCSWSLNALRVDRGPRVHAG